MQHRLPSGRGMLRLPIAGYLRSRSAEVFVAIAFQQGLVLVSGLVCFGLLGAAEYGRVAIAATSASVLIAIGSLSATAVAYRSSLDPGNQERELASILASLRFLLLMSGSVLVSAVLLTYAVGLGRDIFKVGNWWEAVIFASFVASTVVFAYQQGVVLGRCAVRPLLAINVAVFVLGVPVVYAAVSFLGFAGYFLALAVANVVRAFAVEWVLLRPFWAWKGVGRPFRDTISHFMVPATVAGFTTLPAYWIASEMLYREAGGATALGLIGIVTAIKQAPLLACTSLASSRGRQIFSTHSIDDASAAERYWSLLKFMVAFAGVLSIAAVAGFEVLRLVDGMEYISNSDQLRTIVWFLAAVLFLEAVNLAVYIPITITGAMWKSFWKIAVPRDVSLIAMSGFLIHAMGWEGFLLAMVLVQVIGIALTLSLIRKEKDSQMYSLDRRIR